MSQIIELSNGHELEFPDEMSDEQIHAAIQKEYPAKKPSKVWSGEKGLPLNMFGMEAGGTPEENRQTVENLKNPQYWKDIPKGVAQGVANIPSDVGNIPIKTGNWLNNTNAPEFPRFDFAPHTAGTKAGEFLSQFAPLGAAAKAAGPLGEGIKAAGQVMGKAGLNTASKIIAPAQKAKGLIGDLAAGAKTTISQAKGKEIPELERQVAEAQKAHELAMAQAEQAKGYANIETGVGDENRARYKLHGKKEELAALENPEESTLPIQNTVESGRNLQHATEAHQQALSQANGAEQAISTHLNKGAAHDVRVAADVDKVLGAEKKAIGDQFNQVEKSLADKKVVIENPQKAHEIMDELRDYFKKANPEELASLKGTSITHLMSQKDDQVLSALDFMKAIRSIRAHSSDARKLAYSRGLNQADREAAMARYDYLDNVADKMSDILETHIGPEDATKLKEASKAWRERVVPLYKNRIYQNIHYKQQMPANIMNSLRGNDKGNMIIKEAIKSNPETLRNVVGQRFAAKPHELHQPGEITNEYLSKMPELQDLLGQHRQALSRIEPAENAVTQAKAGVEVATKKQKLQNEVETLEKHIKELEKASKNKKQTLKEKVRIENQIKDAKEKRDEARWKIGKILTYGGIGGLVTHYSHIGRLMGSKD